MNLKKLSVIATIIYIGCEAIYNLGLVEFISSPNTEISIYNRLEFFGKSLSAIGLSLVILKAFDRHKLVVFGVLVPSLFSLETVAFDAVVNYLPNDVKMVAYLSGVYRNAALNNTVTDDRISKDTSYNKVLAANIILMGEGGAQKTEVEKIFKFSIEPSAILTYYENYDNLSRKIGSYWSAYSIENKKWSGYQGQVQQKVDAEFLKRSGGIPRGLSREEFTARVADASPSYRQYQTLVIVPGSAILAINEVTGKDLPLGMSKEQFVAYFNTKAAEVTRKTALTAQNVDNLPYSRELVSSVVIPPIAIALSLMSILLNTSILMMGIRRWLAVVPGAVATLAFCTYGSNPYGLTQTANRAIGLEATLHQVLEPVAMIIRKVSINDDKPNELEIVRISKPAPIDFKDLEEKFAALSVSGGDNLPAIPTNIVADEKRLKDDSSYYGEIKGTSNINPYTGQAY